MPIDYRLISLVRGKLTEEQNKGYLPATLIFRDAVSDSILNSIIVGNAAGKDPVRIEHITKIHRIINGGFREREISCGDVTALPQPQHLYLLRSLTVTDALMTRASRLMNDFLAWASTSSRPGTKHAFVWGPLIAVAQRASTQPQSSDYPRLFITFALAQSPPTVQDLNERATFVSALLPKLGVSTDICLGQRVQSEVPPGTTAQQLKEGEGD